MWVNSFLTFEQTPKRARRLVLGFYDSNGKSVKVFHPYNITVPTSLIPASGERLEEILESMREKEELNGFKLGLRRARNFPKRILGVKSVKGGAKKHHVLEITLPNSLELTKHLPREFQKGDYEKVVRFQGYYPERKVTLVPELEDAFFIINQFQTLDLDDRFKAKKADSLLKRASPNSYFRFISPDRGYEAVLDTFGGVTFHNEFLTPEEFLSLSRVYLDIEKCLYKTDEEKERLNDRLGLLKERKKLSNLPKKERTAWILEREGLIEKKVGKLEEELMFAVEGMGEIPFFHPDFDSRVSWVRTRWKNVGRFKKQIDEMIVYDPNSEVDFRTFDGCDIYSEKSERAVVLGRLLPQFKERNPFAIIAQNGAYDSSQLRMAANRLNDIFDPFFHEVQPKRAFVRKFIQYMKQDAVYLDLMWLTKIFHPWLGQRSLGTDFKLETIARHYGIDFTKIMRHQELRPHEVIRLAHPDEKVRREHTRFLATYTGSDVPPLEKATDIEIIDFLFKMKRAMPYLPLTQIATSANCAHLVHEFNHYRRTGNLPFWGYEAKQRNDEIQIFRKRFDDLQRDRIKKEGIEFEGGTHTGVREVYLSLEEAISPLLFKLSPELGRAYRETGKSPGQHFAFLQFLWAFAENVLTDYYFARKETQEFERSKWPTYSNNELYEEEQETARLCMDPEDFQSFYSTFNGIKNLFRSAYVPLSRELRAKLRPSTQNIKELKLPYYLRDEADLYLLKKNEKEVKFHLEDAEDRKNVDRFLKSFHTFDRLWEDLEEDLRGHTQDPKQLVYAVMRGRRAERFNRAFGGRYEFDVNNVVPWIDGFYSNLAANIRRVNGRVIDQKGRYLIIKSDKPVEGVYEVRCLDKYPLQEDLSEEREVRHDQNEFVFK